MSTNVSVKLDEDLLKVAESGESRSETIRDALRTWARENRVSEYPGLNEDQATAYEWMLKRVEGGGVLDKESVETELAQMLSKDRKLIKWKVIAPLSNAGYINVQPRMADVLIWVKPPEVDDDDA